MHAMPKKWILKFEYQGGKVTTTVIARTEAGAKQMAPAGATNVRARAMRSNN